MVLAKWRWVKRNACISFIWWLDWVGHRRHHGDERDNEVDEQEERLVSGMNNVSLSSSFSGVSSNPPDNLATIVQTSEVRQYFIYRYNKTF